MFTNEEIKMLCDAIDMAIASNKRMRVTKPQYDSMFAEIDTRLNALKIKITTPAKNK